MARTKQTKRKRYDDDEQEPALERTVAIPSNKTKRGTTSNTKVTKGISEGSVNQQENPNAAVTSTSATGSTLVPINGKEGDSIASTPMLTNQQQVIEASVNQQVSKKRKRNSTNKKVDEEQRNKSKEKKRRRDRIYREERRKAMEKLDKLIEKGGGYENTPAGAVQLSHSEWILVARDLKDHQQRKIAKSNREELKKKNKGAEHDNSKTKRKYAKKKPVEERKKRPGQLKWEQREIEIDKFLNGQNEIQTSSGCVNGGEQNDANSVVMVVSEHVTACVSSTTSNEQCTAVKSNDISNHSSVPSTNNKIVKIPTVANATRVEANVINETQEDEDGEKLSSSENQEVDDSTSQQDAQEAAAGLVQLRSNNSTNDTGVIFNSNDAEDHCQEQKVNDAIEENTTPEKVETCNASTNVPTVDINSALEESYNLINEHMANIAEQCAFTYFDEKMQKRRYFVPVENEGKGDCFFESLDDGTNGELELPYSVSKTHTRAQKVRENLAKAARIMYFGYKRDMHIPKKNKSTRRTSDTVKERQDDSFKMYMDFIYPLLDTNVLAHDDNTRKQGIRKYFKEIETKKTYIDSGAAFLVLYIYKIDMVLWDQQYGGEEKKSTYEYLCTYKEEMIASKKASGDDVSNITELETLLTELKNGIQSTINVYGHMSYLMLDTKNILSNAMQRNHYVFLREHDNNKDGDIDKCSTSSTSVQKKRLIFEYPIKYDYNVDVLPTSMQSFTAVVGKYLLNRDSDIASKIVKQSPSLAMAVDRDYSFYEDERTKNPQLHESIMLTSGCASTTVSPAIEEGQLRPHTTSIMNSKNDCLSLAHEDNASYFEYCKGQLQYDCKCWGVTENGMHSNKYNKYIAYLENELTKEREIASFPKIPPTLREKESVDSLKGKIFLEAVEHVLENEIKNAEEKYYEVIDKLENDYQGQKFRKPYHAPYYFDTRYGKFQLHDNYKRFSKSSNCSTNQFNGPNRYNGFKEVTKEEYFRDMYNQEGMWTIKGYVFEAAVGSHVENENVECLNCRESALKWCGGSDAPWMDLVCTKCHSTYEIKSKKGDSTGINEEKTKNGCFQGGSFHKFLMIRTQVKTTYKKSKQYLVLVGRNDNDQSTKYSSCGRGQGYTKRARPHDVLWSEISHVTPMLSKQIFANVPGAKLKSHIWLTNNGNLNKWFNLPHVSFHENYRDHIKEKLSGKYNINLS